MRRTPTAYAGGASGCTLRTPPLFWLLMIHLPFRLLESSLLLGPKWWNDEEWTATDHLEVNASGAQHVQRIFGRTLLITSIAPLAPVLIVGFMYSIRLGSCLARDAVTDVIRKAQGSDPTDEARFSTEVAQPALRLEETMEALSRGWGPGFLGLGIACWGFAFSFFCAALNGNRLLAGARSRHVEHVDPAVIAADME